MVEAKRQGHNILKVLGENNYQSTIIYSTKLFFKEEEIEFSINRPSSLSAIQTEAQIVCAWYVCV